MKFTEFVNENKDFKMSMHKIKRAMGDNPSTKDVQEFIEIEAKDRGYELKKFQQYVMKNIFK